MFRCNLRFLVDNDLSPDIATALKCFDFDITHVQDVKEWQTEEYQENGVKDPTVILWCKDNDAVWITHDKKSKRQWGPDIKRARVSVLWTRGKGERFGAWTQFKTVIRVIDEIQRMLRAARGAMHFSAGVRGGPRPAMDWAEHPYDMPKS